MSIKASLFADHSIACSNACFCQQPMNHQISAYFTEPLCEESKSGVSSIHQIFPIQRASDGGNVSMPYSHQHDLDAIVGGFLIIFIKCLYFALFLSFQMIIVLAAVVKKYLSMITIFRRYNYKLSNFDRWILYWYLWSPLLTKINQSSIRVIRVYCLSVFARFCMCAIGIIHPSTKVVDDFFLR